MRIGIPKMSNCIWAGKFKMEFSPLKFEIFGTFQLHFGLHCACDFQMIWPVKASPWMPLEVISGLRLANLFFHSSDLFPRFLRVENPPNPSSKIPSWNPFLPLRLGSKRPDWLSPPNQKRRFIRDRIEESYMVTENHQKVSFYSNRATFKKQFKELNSLKFTKILDIDFEKYVALISNVQFEWSKSTTHSAVHSNFSKIILDKKACTHAMKLLFGRNNCMYQMSCNKHLHFSFMAVEHQRILCFL